MLADSAPPDWSPISSHVHIYVRDVDATYRKAIEAGAILVQEPVTQFGAFIEELQPSSRSSIKHWHSAEDEMGYVLEGEIMLIEGDVETLLRAGDAATFQAGVPVGHFLQNRSTKATRCLVVGTRASNSHYGNFARIWLRLLRIFAIDLLEKPMLSFKIS
jgi:uncharacterized cupin superfamily protein